VQHLIQLAILLSQRLLQPGDVGGDLGAHRRQGLPQAVLLRRQHADQLVAALGERGQRLTLRVGQGTWLRADRLGNMGQRRRVQGVGLGQTPGRLGARRGPGGD
jgi:hypothetical protein